MDNASNAESSRGRRDEYYNYSPLEIFSDSYFTHPMQYGEQSSTNFPPGGLGIEGFVATDYTGSAPQQFPHQIDYQGYQTQAAMGLDVLSAENYQEGVYPQRSSRARGSGSVELYGGFLAPSPSQVEPTSPPTTMKTSRPKKEKSVSADESGTRQRGRPRLDTRDQTAAEVLILN